MLIYYQRKTQIIATIKNIDEYFRYIEEENLLPLVVNFDKIIKYLLDADKLQSVFEIKYLIPKNNFFKFGVIPFIKNTKHLRTEQQYPISLFYKGYSFDDIQKIINDAPTKCKISVQFWLKKGFLPQKAKEIALNYYNDLNYRWRPSSITAFSKDFWVDKGYTHEEAKQKVTVIQNNNNNKFIQKCKTLSDFDRKTLYCTTLEYYLSRGYSMDESIFLRKNRQATFSLEKCIEKQGLELGTQQFYERQIKWQTTLNNKPIEELERINQSKGRTRQRLIDTYGNEKAEEIIRSRITSFGEASKESLNRVIKPLLDKMVKMNISTDDCYYGNDGRSEYYLYNENTKRLYHYDFTIKNSKIIIEYHGKLWHAAPNLTEEELGAFNEMHPFGLKYEEMLIKDQTKRQLAYENGFDIYEIWYYYTDNTINQILDEVCAKCLLK